MNESLKTVTRKPRKKIAEYFTLPSIAETLPFLLKKPSMPVNPIMKYSPPMKQS